MAKLSLKYVQQIGGYYYFRRGRVRATLDGIPGSSEFMAAYQTALGGAPVPAPIGAKRTKPGSINDGIVRYYSSKGHNGFSSMSKSVQQMRRAILERFRVDYGHMPLAMLPKHKIEAALNKLPPHAAKNWLKALRHFMTFAISENLRTDDPTQGIKIKLPKSDGHHTWEEDQIAQYEATHPIGSKARLVLALALYTVQRRGDLILMGRQHMRDGVITIRQQKTKRLVKIPVHPKLTAMLDATPSEHLTFVVNRRNVPYAGNDLSEQFRKWCDEAGLPDECVLHGLRKGGCRRLAELGCSANEIASISGHLTLREVQRYTDAADQAKMASSAMAKMAAAY
jgi:integrase